MANNKGFPSNPSQLTSAVRKALFTSATVTAIAVGAPGHNAYAQQVGACNPISTEFTTGAVQCGGEFDATIEYEVKDFTVVDGEVTPGEIEVIVAEGSTATGILVSAAPAEGAMSAAEGSIVIENHGDIDASAGDNAIDPDSLSYTDFEDVAVRYVGEMRSGVEYTGYYRVDGTANSNKVDGSEVAFSAGVSADDIVDYMAAQGVDVSNGIFEPGREDVVSLIVAPEGLDLEDSAAISAKTEAGNIQIQNTGDVTVGSGVAVAYATSAYLSEHTVSKKLVDIDDDGKNDIAFYGEGRELFVQSGMQYAKAAAIGVDAETTTGNINLGNAGSIEGGDISYGMRAQTVEGDIAITNSGDISVGADSAGISASSEAKAELVYSYGYEVKVDEVSPPRGSIVIGYYQHNKETVEAKIYSADAADNIIEISNTGSISVGEGSIGIEAHNPSGDEITVINSGDISVGAGEGGAGISASTHAGFETFYGNVNEDCLLGNVPSGDDTPICAKVVFAPGEAPGTTDPDFVKGDTYYGMALGTKYIEAQHQVRHEKVEGHGFVDDHGDIAIANAGTIDVSAATGADAILAASYGSIFIENRADGVIEVGDGNSGIHTEGVSDTTVINSGDINIGAGSKGIEVNNYILNPGFVDPKMDSLEVYHGFDSEYVNATWGGFGGDTNVVNTGRISSDVDASELLSYNDDGQLQTNPTQFRSYGIRVSASNASGRGQGMTYVHSGQAAVDMVNERNYERYLADKALVESGELDAEDAWEYNKIEIRDHVELFDTNVVNRGEIALGDMSTGISVGALFGEATVVNDGTISVGDGVFAVGEQTDVGAYPVRLQGVYGIHANSRQTEALSTNRVYNTANGIVSTGDVGTGLRASSVGGSAYVTNEGEVTVGSGKVITAGDVTLGKAAVGMQANTQRGWDAYARALNTGSINTGDNAIGIAASNNTTGLFLTPEFGRYHTAVASNTGDISMGDGAIGIGVSGAHASLGYNGGNITIGSGDLVTGASVLGGAGMASMGGIYSGNQSTLINQGSIVGGDGVSGMDAGALFVSAAMQGQNGSITVGDDSYGMRSVGFVQAFAQNEGAITAGDDSVGMHTYAIYAATINTGDIEVGDDSTGIAVTGSSAYARNYGNVSTGDNSTGIKVSSVAVPGFVVNSGNINTGRGGVAIELIGEDYLDLETGVVFPNTILNSGNITGSIITSDSDDVLRNGFRYDNSGNIAGVGRITLNDAAIDMGAGRNTFINEAGDIVFSGDSAIELGAQGTMVNYSGGANYVTISSLDDQVGDTLTINGDVTFANIQSVGSLFLVDVSSTASDNITINGDLNVVDLLNQAGDTQPGDLRVAMNVTDQSKGAQTTGAILTVNGEQNVDSVSLAALGGDFADTILEAEMQQDGNGNWVIAYTAGLSNLGAAASSVSHLAESFWTRSASAFFDSERAANMSESSRVEGLHAWSSVFHTDSDVASRGDVKGQDLAYTQLLSNHMAGATYNTKLGGTWLSISPMVGKGYADGNQLAQQSSAALDTETFALNGTLSMGDFYASAMYQQVDFDANVRAYDSAAMTSGQAKGYSLEGGWTYLMESGIAMTSFAQWSDVKSEIDGFTSSDGNFDYAYNLGSTSTTRLGLSMRKSFKLSDGFAMPYATFSVADSSNHDAHDLHANGVVFNSDVSGTGFNIDFGVDGKYKLWTIKTGLGVHSGDTDKNGLSGHFAISRSL
ncbi:hypothetical protein [Microbulbifer elongatus]|uniref:hypothetical protein n=1 Tax=Microbulbifer elongatus TaxID=86173 RepID=UPI001CFCFFD8|nr:hypothetical protein [Microbulbifer elongatus]